MLAVIETHPVQYHAPVYRVLQQQCGIPVTAIYGSDFSIAGYRDPGFQTSFAWNTDLLSGYDAVFLSRAEPGASVNPGHLPTAGLARALRTVNPTAVLVVGYSPRFHRMAWYEAWRQRRPILFRGETNDEARPRSGPEQWLRRTALRVVPAGAPRVCTSVSDHARTSNVWPWGRTACSFPRYCVDETTFDADENARALVRADTRHALGLDPQQIVVLFSGKLVRAKGVDAMVPAIRALPPERRARVVLAFLGDGERRASIAEAAAADPSVATRFLGFQNQRELSRDHHVADLLVLPSRHGETWGLVTNEALLHGLPCVVSDGVGSAPDSVREGRTGHVFATDSIPGLARALDATWPLLGRRDVRDACRALVAGYSTVRAAQGIADVVPGRDDVREASGILTAVVFHLVTTHMRHGY